MRKVSRATSPDQRFQLITRDLQTDIAAVDEFWRDRSDYGPLVKVYADTQQKERPILPPNPKALKVRVSGNPEEFRVCTSHVERQNLTMRMPIRRLTRPTDAFRKKLDNHKTAVALHFASQHL